MVRILPFLALLLASAAPAAAPRAPRRIVSLNLCADQYLLALADPGQIVGLTPYARDRGMSAAAARAGRIPATRGSAEEVLLLRPELVIAGPARATATAALLRGRGAVVLPLPPADSYAQLVGQVRAVARAVGHPARGEAMVAAMDRRLARVPRDAGGGRVAAYYQRRGYLTGTGTLVNEMMNRVGLVNLAARRGLPVLSRLSLETMALARPDFLVVETDADRVEDQGTEMLHHPVLRSIARLRLPQAWTVCGGPAYVLAVESLARQLAAAPKAPSRASRR